jgi:hypothetical protein
MRTTEQQKPFMMLKQVPHMKIKMGGKMYFPKRKHWVRIWDLITEIELARKVKYMTVEIENPFSVEVWKRTKGSDKITELLGLLVS